MATSTKPVIAQGTNADAIATLLHGRRIGRRKWQARCPAHDDRDPSLTIREGRDGRVLVKCWAGCTTAEVLRVAGLTWADLFLGGPPPSSEQIADAERQRRIADAEAREQRRERGILADRHRELNSLLHAIGARLASMPKGKDGDEIAAVFHAAIDQYHNTEMKYEGIEAQEFHQRLIRYCEHHHIDRERLLALYGPPVETTGAAA